MQYHPDSTLKLDTTRRMPLRLNLQHERLTKQSAPFNYLPDPAAIVAAGAAPGVISDARTLLDAAAATMTHTFRSVRRGEQLDTVPLLDIAERLIRCYEVCANALLWALLTDRQMHYMSRRSVGSAILILAFGRHLGYQPPALLNMVVGGLLLDIGKTDVPISILAKKAELTAAERRIARRHVAASVRILQAAGDLAPETIEMVRSHHERFDGSGYPNGTHGIEISLYAQMAGIVDSFDALSLNRYYAAGISAHAALRKLQDQRGGKFNDALIDKFVAAIGAFPTGSWIQLNNGDIGLVCLQNSIYPSHPYVACIASNTGECLPAVHWLALQQKDVMRVLQPGELPAYATALQASLQARIYA